MNDRANGIDKGISFLSAKPIKRPAARWNSYRAISGSCGYGVMQTIKKCERKNKKRKLFGCRQCRNLLQNLRIVGGIQISTHLAVWQPLDRFYTQHVPPVFVPYESLSISSALPFPNLCTKAAGIRCGRCERVACDRW
jgi:hypothetical protein